MRGAQALLLLGMIAATARPAPAELLLTPAAELDHVILAVPDLDAASRACGDLGFLIKPGRMHPNRLLNRHLKFGDGTEIELMTVRGEPGDPMARDYARLLESGAGGAYVALRTPDLRT